MNNLSPESQSFIVFLSQIVFVYLRTINVKAISEEKPFMALLSGNAQAITGLISLAIGIYSIIDLNVLPIIAYLLGGSLGIFLAMKSKKMESISFKAIIIFISNWLNAYKFIKREVTEKN
jgi:hypothetical protein